MPEVNRHVTTMNPLQRKILIEILERDHDLKKLALFTDTQLHEQWLIDCEYPNPYKIEL